MKLIVDGNYVLNNGWYVLTNYGLEDIEERMLKLFCQMIEKYKRDFNTQEIYIAWDGMTGTKWRKEILPEYKSNRSKEGKEGLYACIDVCRSTNYNHFWIADMEGDDCIYCLCKLLDGTKVIISGDHDFAQLVQQKLARGVFMPVQKKYMEIPEHDSILEKSVCGDSSDNLSGLKGIGPKGFIKLIENNFSTLKPEQLEILEKHKLIIGLKNNPNMDKNLSNTQEILNKYLTNSL